MKSFLNKFLLFLIPFGAYLILIVLTDPYNKWNNCFLIPIETKLRISKELNSRLWKVVQYNRDPSPNIMLGDSRVDIINTDRIYELSGEQYFNFAYPGSTLDEIIETFWYASGKATLENVIIGVNFNLYNRYNNKNLVKPILKSAQTVDYLLNGANIKAISVCFYDIFKGGSLELSTPNMGEDAFWKEKLDGTAARYYKLYKYPDNYFRKLQEIAEYCNENNIKLTFFIPPTHVDLQNKISEHALIPESEKFKADIRSLGTVYDFDYDSWLTSQRENFSDPFHLNIALDTVVINTLINNRIYYSRYSTNDEKQR
jgi:hypothetical protein